MLNLARLIIIAGVILVLVGVGIYLLARSGLPIGRLPGDFRFQVGNVTCFFPLVTSLLLSVVLTVLLNIILRILRK